MKIIIGADDFGFELKEKLVAFLIELGVDVSNYNPVLREEELYPDIAVGVASQVADGMYDRAILICGTGTGMCIVANKIPGIRAVVCHDVYTAERAMQSNDAHIACLGSEIVGFELAKKLIKIWIECEFAGGRSIPKLERIKYYDKKFRG